MNTSENMNNVVWLDQYNTGIAEIDTQHRQIVDYLNQLNQARKARDTRAVREVVEGIVDYTLSHFAFEEAMMEEASYGFFRAHKNVHDTFIKRVDKFRDRLAAGENITDEFHDVLKRWLVNHIQRDDAAYVRPVKAHLEAGKPAVVSADTPEAENSWLARAMKRFFGRS